MVTSGNFEHPYVEGTWMVEAIDSGRSDNVRLVGPDEKLRLVVEYPGSLWDKIQKAREMAKLLNAGLSQTVTADQTAT